MFILRIGLRYFILREEQGKKYPQSEILLKFSCNHGDQWTVVTLMAVVACTHRDFCVFVRFETSTLMLLRMQVFWYVMPCCCCSVFRSDWDFWGSNKHSLSTKTLIDEGTSFFRNVGKLSRWQPHSSNLKTLKNEGTNFSRIVGQHQPGDTASFQNTWLLICNLDNQVDRCNHSVSSNISNHATIETLMP
jgi:hypothetical protein